MVKYLDKNSGFNQWIANQNSKSGAGSKTSKFTGFLWWLVIFLLAWWAFSAWFSPKQDVLMETQDTSVAEQIANIPASSINSDKISATIRGIRIENIKLSDYKESKKSDKNISLLASDGEFLEIGLMANGTSAPAVNTVWMPVKNKESDTWFWKNKDGIEFRRIVSAKDYIITVKDEIINKTDRDVSFAPYARMLQSRGQGNVAVETGAVAYVNSEMEWNDLKRLDKKSYAYQTSGGFMGFADQYWETIVEIDALDQTIRVNKSGANYQIKSDAAPIYVSAGKTETIETKVFAGPRDQAVLNAAADIMSGINKTMDYGWFWFLSRPMLWALNAINDLVMNYGIAIILLTIGLRILMWPLTRKSYVSMAAMQKMQPELAKIQKLYAGDKARLQMEMMRVYQTHKTSPMSGCLPMLLQIPIFFALYKALLISVPMRQAGFLWISDLAVMDPYFILPVLMGATMWWQQRLQSSATPTGNSSDPMAQTQKIMKWLPVVFTAMFAWMPAGLVLYWMVSNLFGIGQIYVIKKVSK